MTLLCTNSERHLEQKILDLALCNKVLLLLGTRQVGKSTLLKTLFPQLLHITFDPLQDSYGVRTDPDLFLKNFPPPLILDEVQYVPELLSAMKRFVDIEESYGQYFLTGSQNFSMLKSVSESLARRVSILKLLPMTFLELAGSPENKIHNHWIDGYLQRDPTFWRRLKPCPQVSPIFEAIWRGGMPGLIERSSPRLSNYFESYYRLMWKEISVPFQTSKIFRILQCLYVF